MIWPFHLTCGCDYKAYGRTAEEAKQELERHTQRVHERYERENNLPDSRRKP